MGMERRPMQMCIGAKEVMVEPRPRDGSKSDLWTLEADKYRVRVIHEFLSLTLEKRTYIHNIVEFKEELSNETYLSDASEEALDILFGWYKDELVGLF
ncbi:hypothetical protein M9H77_18172 [Catharanthus roseus]|uniref:Uncharacterized protein n=1 Tax=Catharanthus roseus TaxID=4058 RepID=A0ACC0B6S1_CATRO|nr:hypothetical protein M9H77_18172 [Catharanthus roseus]